MVCNETHTTKENTMNFVAVKTAAAIVSGALAVLIALTLRERSDVNWVRTQRGLAKLDRKTFWKDLIQIM